MALGVIAGTLFAVPYVGTPGRLIFAPLYLMRGALGGMIWNAVGAICAVFALLFIFQRHGSAIIPAGFLAAWPTYRAIVAFSVLGARKITTYMVTDLDISRSVSPAEALRLDRHATWSVWALRRALGAAAAWLWAGPEVAAAYGLFAVIATLTRIVLGSTTSAAQGYTEARLWLWLTRRMPWRIMSFLEDAHRRGVLRQVGTVYQFRHIRLQERLAVIHPPWTRQAPLRAIAVTETLIRELIGSVAMGLAVFLDDEEIIAADDETARKHGWQVTVVRRGLRRYRDPRFDRIACHPADDADARHTE